MTFKDFIATMSVTDDQSGDFIHDVMRDKEFPVTEQTHERLTQYFDYQSRFRNNPAVLTQFKKLWKIYQNHLV